MSQFPSKLDLNNVALNTGVPPIVPSAGDALGDATTPAEKGGWPPPLSPFPRYIGLPPYTPITPDDDLDLSEAAVQKYKDVTTAYMDASQEWLKRGEEYRRKS